MWQLCVSLQSWFQTTWSWVESILLQFKVRSIGLTLVCLWDHIVPPRLWSLLCPHLVDDPAPPQALSNVLACSPPKHCIDHLRAPPSTHVKWSQEVINYPVTPQHSSAVELFTKYRTQLSYLLIVSRAYISHSYYYVYYLYTGSIYHIGDERKPIKDLGAAQTVKTPPS